MFYHVLSHEVDTFLQMMARKVRYDNYHFPFLQLKLNVDKNYLISIKTSQIDFYVFFA